MRAVIYSRISTNRQHTENQSLQLREIAKRNNWVVVAELTDEGISGSRGRNERPSFDTLHKMILRREVDVVMTFSIDRLSRSIHDLVNLMGIMDTNKVELYSYLQSIDTRTPSGKLTYSIFAAIAEFERELIRERINAGLARAKANGKKLGRPSCVNENTKVAVKLLREKGASIHNIARELKIGVGTTQKILKEAA